MYVSSQFNTLPRTPSNNNLNFRISIINIIEIYSTYLYRYENKFILSVQDNKKKKLEDCE